MMDLESAIQHCEEVADTPCFTDEEARCYSEHRQLAEWLKELKAYKKNTCGDAISRQAVAKILLKYAHTMEGKAFAEFLISQINNLPSVTPQQRTGRWTKKEHNGIVLFMCSNCRKEHLLLYDYCPTCGAKMEVKDAD